MSGLHSRCGLFDCMGSLLGVQKAVSEAARDVSVFERVWTLKPAEIGEQEGGEIETVLRVTMEDCTDEDVLSMKRRGFVRVVPK